MTRFCFLRGQTFSQIILKGDFVKFSVRKFSYDLTSKNGNEYSATPEYPPIYDTGIDFRKEKKIEQWHSKIQAVKTVEEKLFSVNMPKYYGWTSFDVTEQFLPYNTLPFFEYITRTKFVQQDIEVNQPHTDSDIRKNNSDVINADNTVNTSSEDDLLRRVKSQIQLALIFEWEHRRSKNDSSVLESPAQEEDKRATSIVQQINRILISNLSSHNHILTAQIDYEPRVEAFWFVGGFEFPKPIRKERKGARYMTPVEKMKPVDQSFQYIGSPILQVRGDLPLKPVEFVQSCESTKLHNTKLMLDPRVYGFSRGERRNGTNIPGFWPGDSSSFGLISYHRRGHLLERQQFYGIEDEDEAINSQAILASYGWLLPQACYQGFSTYNDITYPLVTQTVITNGQTWSFYTYQMNTTVVNGKHGTDNPKCNVCWGTKSLKLFEEIQDGEVKGFNDTVLKKLISMYLNTPQIRKDTVMQPYLGSEEKLVADIEDDERREWMEEHFKHMYSCRPRHRLPYELYHWEKIYKVDHKTRPRDARRRPFELSINPYKRTYDAHARKYWPKKLRPEIGKKWKFRKIFYPTTLNES